MKTRVSPGIWESRNCGLVARVEVVGEVVLGSVTPDTCVMTCLAPDYVNPYELLAVRALSISQCWEAIAKVFPDLVD